MIARSLEDNIPEPLAHVQAEAARRIGGTRPRSSLLDTRRDDSSPRPAHDAGGARAVSGEGSVRSAAASSPGEQTATTASTLPWLLSGALSMTLWRLMAASRSLSNSASYRPDSEPY